MKLWIGKNKHAITAFLLSFCCAFLSLVIFIVLGGGVFSLSNDYNAQEWSFNMFASQAIKNGDVFWNWNIDLGSDFVTTFSFYNLGSPFFWIMLLFPIKSIPYLMGWVYMLKYAVAGLTSYLFLERFSQHKKISVCCSLLYAFCGFQCCNLVFYHFHDVVALFPLLLLGLEIMMKERKKGVFALAVFANAFLNYFFFVGEVIFVIVYFVVRFFCEEWKNVKRVPQCMWEGILGTGMAGALFVPSCMGVLNNTRFSEKISGLGLVLFDWKDYLRNVKALILPAENMAKAATLSEFNWYSVSAYLPLVGIVLVVAYLIRSKGTWLKRMIVACFAMMFIPAFNNAFVLFTSEPYRRWYYMMVLMLVLASQEVLEHRKEYPIVQGGIYSLGLIGGICLILCSMDKENIGNVIYRPVIFGIMVAVAIGGVIVTCVVTTRLYKHMLPVLTVSIMCVAVFTTGLTIYTYRQNDEHGSSQDTYHDVVGTGENLERDVLPYRYKFWENYYNRGLASYLPTRNSFSSTVSSSIFELYDMLGEHRHTIGVNGPEGTDELLGAGYFVANYEDDNLQEITSYHNGFQQIWVYDIKSLPIGFAYDSYMTQTEFLELSQENRACGMLRCLVVRDDDEQKVEGVLRHVTMQDEEIRVDKKEEYIKARSEDTISGFKYDTSGFQAEITLDEEKYVFFSVPYDAQWKAEVNGKSTEILNINGLMAVKTEKGRNQIVFSYTALYFKIGVAISIISALILIAWCVIIRSGTREKRGNKEWATKRKKG
ncbi:MAG: YfhO family protein [Ruminococcus sp.]|nr:YfhO family protein [Ruminococcus sp.]